MSKRRPSAAMIVAMIALCLGLGGSAIAAGDLTKRDVKKIAKKVANKQITKRASGLSVANAANAGKVNGQSVTKMFTKLGRGQSATAFSANGLTLTATCTSGGLLDFTATTSVDDSIVASEGSNSGTDFGFRQSEFDAGTTEDVLAGEARGNGTLTYSTPDGAYVTATFAADDTQTFGAFDGCVVVGSAISG